ncbi:hypothetical protein FPV67DRAFT_1460821 [Lyophyllum atratum]|nr:hypothetical protein FPV67DRAFT_1460821 [Lyophyllum atratum]
MSTRDSVCETPNATTRMQSPIAEAVYRKEYKWGMITDVTVDAQNNGSSLGPQLPGIRGTDQPTTATCKGKVLTSGFAHSEDVAEKSTPQLHRLRHCARLAFLEECKQVISASTAENSRDGRSKTRRQLHASTEATSLDDSGTPRRQKQASMASTLLDGIDQPRRQIPASTADTSLDGRYQPRRQKQDQTAAVRPGGSEKLRLMRHKQSQRYSNSIPRTVICGNGAQVQSRKGTLFRHDLAVDDGIEAIYIAVASPQGQEGQMRHQGGGEEVDDKNGNNEEELNSSGKDISQKSWEENEEATGSTTRLSTPKISLISYTEAESALAARDADDEEE